jgi:WD40 repeat protein
MATSRGEANPLTQIWRLQFAPAGGYVAAAGQGGVAAWEVQRTPQGPRLKRSLSVPAPRGDVVYDLAIHPHGAELVFLDSSGHLHAYDVAHRRGPRPLGVASQQALRGLHFDAAGEQLTFVTPRSTLGVLRWADGAARDTGHRVYQLALESGGRWAATSSPGREVVVCDLSGDPCGPGVLTLPAEAADVWGVAWSPDGRRLAVALSDGGVAVWDLEEVRARLAEFDILIPSTARPGLARS